MVEVEYNGELLSLEAIAEKEHISYSTLLKYYNKYNNINSAITRTKVGKDLKGYLFRYDGDLFPIEGIARLENIDSKKLLNAFEECGDIYKAVELITGRKSNTNKPITKVSKIEFKEEKQKEQEDKKLLVNGSYLTKQEFAKRINMPILVLEENLHNRKDSDTLQREYFKKDKMMQFILEYNYEGESIIDYCAKNNIDYTALARFITTYSVYPDMAVSIFKENNFHIPKSYIEKKYSKFLKYLKAEFGINADTLIDIISSENTTILDALSKYEFRGNSKYSYLEEIYDYIMYYSGNIEKKNAILSKLDLKPDEKAFLATIYKKLRTYKKQVSLFEMSEYAKDYYQDKKDIVFRSQDLSDEEINIIYTWFYNNDTEEYSMAA